MMLAIACLGGCLALLLVSGVIGGVVAAITRDEGNG
jgi:hypothetical protein